MNEDLTAVVDAVATKIGMAADALAPITETLAREVATKHELLMWADIAFAGWMFGTFVACCVFIIRCARKTDLDSTDGPDGYATAGIFATLAALFVGVTAITNAANAIGHAAKAASPTLTLLESVLR